jgi:hypothetical protein
MKVKCQHQIVPGTKFTFFVMPGVFLKNSSYYVYMRSYFESPRLEKYTLFYGVFYHIAKQIQ